MKTCNTCKQEKDDNEFRPKDARCRTCYNAARRADYANRPEHFRAEKKKHRDANVEAARKRYRDWYKEHKEERAEYWQEWSKQPESKEKIQKRSRERYSKDPHVSARRLIQAMVQRGTIPAASTRRCVDCGGQAEEYDHYLGYEGKARYMVEPVCYTCHRKRHV